MITSHLYTKKNETPVFISPDMDSMPIHILQLHIWVGVLERRGDWIKIIGIACDGWVRAEDMEERPPFELHANWFPDQPIKYVSSEK